MIIEIILIVGLVCGILLAIVVFSFALADLTTDGANLTNIAAIIGAILYVMSFFIYVIQPKAIDVYRGNTMLEITYNTDTIPTDTIVVWKKN